jgi:hypothetical protein
MQTVSRKGRKDFEDGIARAGMSAFTMADDMNIPELPS